MSTFYRAWCNDCHANTLHRLSGYSADLWACVHCLKAIFIQQENDRMTIEAKLDDVNKNLLAIGEKLDALLKASGGSAPAGKASTKSTEPKALTYGDVKKPFLALVQSHGRDVALAAIATVDESFKSLKDAEAKTDQFPALLEAVNKAAAGPKPEAVA